VKVAPFENVNIFALIVRVLGLKEVPNDADLKVLHGHSASCYRVTSPNGETKSATLNNSCCALIAHGGKRGSSCGFIRNAFGGSHYFINCQQLAS
jgi:hypothetical protein